MAILSVQQATAYAQRAGFVGQSLAIIVAIAQAESGLNTLATNTTGNSAGTDRGIVQINSYYHSEVSDACAFDPLCAFQSAYKISSGGSNFTPWSTYTSGAYKRYLSGGSAPAQKPWYLFPWARDYGGKEPFGNFPKPDLNIQLPPDYPVTAIGAGVVSGIDTTSAWGASVTVRLAQPINPIATHEAYLHLARPAPGTYVGEPVQVGQLIGYNGGVDAAGTQKVPLGFALYEGDDYGHGLTWAQNVGSPALDPTAVLQAAANGLLSTVGFTGGVQGMVDAGQSVSQQLHDTLVSTPGFLGIVEAVDEAEQLPGFINFATSPLDASGIVRSVIATVMDNSIGIAFRGLLISVGMLLLAGLVWNAVQESGVSSQFQQLAPYLAGAAAA